MAVAAAATAVGLGADEIAAGLQCFAGVKRRQELRGVVDGVAGPEAPKNYEVVAPLGQVIYMGAVAGYPPKVDISRELYQKSVAVRGFLVYTAMAATGAATPTTKPRKKL